MEPISVDLFERLVFRETNAQLSRFGVELLIEIEFSLSVDLTAQLSANGKLQDWKRFVDP